MQEIIREYGAAVVGAVGAFLFFGALGGIMLGKSGLLAQMIMLWGNGGC